MLPLKSKTFQRQPQNSISFGFPVVALKLNGNRKQTTKLFRGLIILLPLINEKEKKSEREEVRNVIYKFEKVTVNSYYTK